MWTYLRHYINLRIIYSLLNEFRTIGPYGLDWESEQYKCLLSNVITFGLLASLQTLNLFWLYCLLRNAYKFVYLGIAKDDRSEDEAPEADAVDQGEDGVDNMLPDQPGKPSFQSGDSIAMQKAKRMTTLGR